MWGTRSDRSAMLIVFLVVVIDLLGFGIVLPLLPRIADSYITVVIGQPARQTEQVALPEHTELIGYSAAGLSLVALVLGVWLLRETRRFSEQPASARRWFDASGWRFALTSLAIGPVI